MSMLTGYADFESILIKTAEQEGWEFRDGDEAVGADAVFNYQTYGPALLRVAELELADRGITVSGFPYQDRGDVTTVEDLGLVYTSCHDALMGVEVSFIEESASEKTLAYKRMIYRLALSIAVLKSLPRIDGSIDLSLLSAIAFDDVPRPENA
ncbi:hypothetical protein LJR168_003804 [Pseudoxanthomonas sp. LjRoot168]|uniref:hypothetical protein n=2 Tax=unclassified Pseudoxanthomonas TaxID=2645906 RepID=UPI003ECF1CF7